MLERDAIVIGDGGDFVSYAGRVIETFEPGTLDGPGAVRLPRRRPGQAIGAACAQPGPAGLPAARRRRVRVQRPRVRHDGPPRAAGRRRDGQQRHLGAREAPDGVPLRLLDRRRAAPETRATSRWSRPSAATASSSAEPDELRPALERAFASGKPALVNVLTDPDVVYPRKAVLA